MRCTVLQPSRVCSAKFCKSVECQLRVRKRYAPSLVRPLPRRRPFASVECARKMHAVPTTPRCCCVRRVRANLTMRAGAARHARDVSDTAYRSLALARRLQARESQFDATACARRYVPCIFRALRPVASGTCGVRPVHRAHSGDGNSRPAVANGLCLAQQAGSSPWEIDEGVDHNQAVERRSQTA